MSRDDGGDNWAGVRGPLLITLAALLLGGGFFLWSARSQRARFEEQQAFEAYKDELTRQRAAQQPPPAP
jgi:hypothetical protein